MEKRASSNVAYSESLFWWGVIGGIASSPGWISLLVRFLDIDLSQLPELALQSYREMTTGFFEVILFWVDWRPPQPLIDVLVIHLTTAGICLRADFIAKGPLFEHKQYYKESGEVLHFVFGLLVPLYLPTYIIARRIHYDDGRKAARKRFGWILKTGASDTAKIEEWNLELHYSNRVKDRYGVTVKFLILGAAALMIALLLFFALDAALQLVSTANTS